MSSEEIERLKTKLGKKLTDEFLELLKEAVKTCGWICDMEETGGFVDWCYEAAGRKPPDPEELKPLW